MKNRKRRVELLSFYDHVGISRHLEKMAAKGWMLEKITNLGWVYRRIEPKQLHFTVSYYSKASEFDPEPTGIRKHFMISALIRAGSLLAPQFSCRFFIMSERIPRLSRRMLSWRYRLSMLPQRKVSYRHILPCS